MLNILPLYFRKYLAWHLRYRLPGDQPIEKGAKKMNFVTVFLPFFIILFLCGMGLFLFLFALAEILLYQRVPSAGALFVVFTLCTVSIFYIMSDRWIRAAHTRNWDEEIQAVDIAVILGFGIENDKDEQLRPGNANQFLLKWATENTRAQTLLVQEGVWIAACDSSDSICKLGGRKLKRIHGFSREKYINTMGAAYCALEQMEKLGKKKAVIVAHDLHLERAAWDFIKVKKSQKRWHSFQFVIPEISNTPFPDHSSQWHTRNAFVYKFVELFLSRPRDYLFKVPYKCPLPAASEI